MNGPDSSFDSLPLASKQRIDEVCARFEKAWSETAAPPLEPFLVGLPEAEQPAALVELILIEIEYRKQQGESPDFADYLQRFPQHAARLRKEIEQTLPASDTMSEQGGAWPEVPDYELIGSLGHGGMGVVYSARHKPLNRIVALKFILPGRQRDALQRQRFRQEAEAIARLRHPNIVAIYDIGEVNDSLFLTLEYADGGSLRDRLTGGPLHPYLAAKMLEPIVRAVMHAHRHGVIHRDIKPANVLLTISGDSIALENQPLPDMFAQRTPLVPLERVSLRDCTPKLTDFGLARLVDDEVSSLEAGMAAGTPSYMSPEQARGEGDYTVEVDIWALGATLYEMLSGKPPFKGATARETMEKILFEQPVPLQTWQPSIPRELERICLKCLNKDPEQRYASARDLAQDLNHFLSHYREPTQRFSRGWWIALGVGGLIALGAVGLFLLLR
jgi:serine/threonine protein kinase